MISFNCPENLDGEKLLDELAAAGIVIEKSDEPGLDKEPPFLDGNGLLWLAINLKDEATTQSIVDAHLG